MVSQLCPTSYYNKERRLRKAIAWTSELSVLQMGRPDKGEFLGHPFIHCFSTNFCTIMLMFISISGRFFSVLHFKNNTKIQWGGGEILEWMQIMSWMNAYCWHSRVVSRAPMLHSWVWQSLPLVQVWVFVNDWSVCALPRKCSFLPPNVYRLSWLTYRNLSRLANSFFCAVHKSAVGFWIVDAAPQECTRPTWFQLFCTCAGVCVFSLFSRCTSEVLGPTPWRSS